MDKKKIIIIGAGIAGLSAGCYGQMNGYQTKIYEMHTTPGGLCTSWKRKGYTFDGCIHWLVGTNPKRSMHKIWRELGALKDMQVVNHEVFRVLELSGGKEFYLYSDINRLEEEMLAISPKDGVPIRELMNAIRRLEKMENFADDPQTVGESIKALFSSIPAVGTLMRYQNMTIGEFAKKIKHPFLREVVNDIFGGPEFPIMGFLMTMGWLNQKDAGYPVGGSLAFSRAIEKRYLEQGGQIQYQARVEKILVKDNQAVGIRLSDGSEHFADLIVSAADGHATIFEMLDGKYADETVRGYYDHLEIFQPVVQVSLGINRRFDPVRHSFSVSLDKPIHIAGDEHKIFAFHNYDYDPTLAPEGKSVLVCMFNTNHAYWKKLAEEPERYDAEKKQIALTVINLLNDRFPGLEDQVEVVDVATPLTTERYTGNWQGSIEGWMINKETMKIMMSGKGMSKTLPGLKNFYMTGQWVEPGGGLPTAAMSGRKLIKMLCKLDGKRFSTTENS